MCESRCKNFNVSDKNLGVWIRAYHFNLPLYIYFAILLCNKSIATISLITHLSLSFSLFIWMVVGCLCWKNAYVMTILMARLIFGLNGRVPKLHIMTKKF